MLCTGNNTEYCGAGNRLSLYMYNATSTSSTKLSSSTQVSRASSQLSTTSSQLATTSSKSSTTTTSGTTSSASPTGTLIGGYGYVGCQTDAGANARTLSSTSFTDTAMTVETCSSFCGARGYTYFGVEYGRWHSLNSHFLSQIYGKFLLSRHV
jgi:hypothetical protein